MHIDNNFFVGLFFLSFVCCIIGYTIIDDIIWSIVWCDKGGKYNSLIKLKKKSLKDILTMKYLEEHITYHKKSFRFWLSIRNIYAVLEILLLATYLILYFIDSENSWYNVFMIFVTLQSVISFLFFIFQTDINRNTKYDRIRLYRKRKK